MCKYLLRNKSVRFLLPVLLLVFIIDSVTLGAAAAEPKEQLQQSVDEILQILQSDDLKGPGKKEERHRLVLNVVENMFDFREMARSSLGQSWNTLTPEEHDRFVELFTKLIEQRYIGKIDSYNNQRIVYQKELIRDDRAMVYTSLIDKEQEIPIVYRMGRLGDKWLIYDVKIENVSLIVNYRRDFDSIIRKEKFAGLVEKITKQLEKSETSN